MTDARPTPMELRAAVALCKQQADVCNVNRDDLWKLHSDDFLKDAREVLAAIGAPELLQAAKHVAFSNGFDAALPDKMEALRAAIAKAGGAA